MCSILGLFLGNGLNGYRHAVQSANDLVHYRGPDGQGFLLVDTRSRDWLKAKRLGRMPREVEAGSENLILAHRRLAIIDLTSSGLQPMPNHDQSLWIVYNGEVYNYLELRRELERLGHQFQSHSDTEVILSAYSEWGERCVERFNGMWAFAIADLKRRRIFCSRDRFGVKPFHYFWNDRFFAFSSEIKQLLQFPFVHKEVNKRTIYEYLAFGAIDYCPETCFSNILNLLPGHSLIFDCETQSLVVKPYYQPKLRIDHAISYQDAADEFRNLLTDSVRLRLRSDVPVGSCLSGGLDSSSIVCIMHNLLAQKGQSGGQHTFSSHFEEKEANELEYMQEVIGAVSVEPHFIYPTPNDLMQDLKRLIWHQEEPFGSTSIFAQWSVFKLVHENGIKVMLDGQGADEMLAGYIPLSFYYFKELHEKRAYARLMWETSWHARRHGKPLLSLLPNAVASWLQRFPLRKRTNDGSPTINWIAPDLEKQFREQSYYLDNQQIKPFGPFEHLNNTLYQLTFINNIPQLLKYEDRNSMAFSVESRVPFLDYRLVEFAFSLPSHFKIRNGFTKRILRDSMAGVLPEKIRWRTSKLGFATPEQKWQKTVLRPFIIKAIRDEKLQPFLISEQAENYLRQADKIGVSNFIPWRWANLLLWMEAFDLA